MSAGDPVRRLALIAHLDRRQWEQGRDVVPMLEAAASSDPEVARMLDGWKQQRAAMIADAVRAIGSSLRPDVAPEWAVATVRALSPYDVFNELVRGEGWSPERYEEWLALLLAGLLLGGQVAAPVSS